MGELLSGLLTGLQYWFNELITGLWNFMSKMWGLVVIASGIAYIVGAYAVRGFTSIVDTMTSMATSAGSSGGIVNGIGTLTPDASVMHVLAIGNTFFPLDEMCQYAASYITVAVIVIVYRNIKSWIPTLSGT